MEISENTREMSRKANEIRKNGNYEEAIDIYKQIWAIQEDAYTGAGILHCLRKLNKFDEAESFAKELLILYPSINWVKIEVSWVLATISLKKSQSFEETLEIAERITLLNNNFLLLKIIAFKLAKLSQKNSEYWRTTLEWHEKIDPKQLNTDVLENTKWSDKNRWYYNLFKGYLNTGQYSKILAEIDQFINEFIQVTEYFQRLKGKAYIKIENYDEAEKIYLELVDNKNHWWIYKEYGELLQTKEKYKEALFYLSKASFLNRSIKTMVKVYMEIGEIFALINRNEDSFYHFMLCFLIRKKENWSIPDELLRKLEDLSKIYPEISQLDSIERVIYKCREIWQKECKIYEKSQLKEIQKREFKGNIKLGKRNTPFCFINTKKESIICLKSILSPDIRNNDFVLCEAIPDFDKKKQRDSWKAIKVKKL